MVLGIWGPPSGRSREPAALGLDPNCLLDGNRVQVPQHREVQGVTFVPSTVLAPSRRLQ